MEDENIQLARLARLFAREWRRMGFPEHAAFCYARARAYVRAARFSLVTA